MQTKILIFTAFVMTVIGSSCASLPQANVNEPLLDKEDEFRITVPNRAFIGVMGSIKKGENCDSVDLKAIDLRLEPKDFDKKIEMTKDCQSFKNAVWIRSKNLEDKGNYELKFSLSKWHTYSGSKPHVRVRYENAEFSSDKNQVPTGAVTLAGDQTVSDSVDYNQGDFTDWFQIEPDSRKVNLTFEHLDSQTYSIAHLYRRKKKSRRLNHVFRLKPGRGHVLTLSPENEYFVRVRSFAYQTGSKYVLRKKNIAESPKEEKKMDIYVPVVDCFAVDSEFSTALIKNDADLKIGEILEIQAKTSEGKTVNLGNCHISSVFNDQASCRLNTVVKREFVQFKGKVL